MPTSIILMIGSLCLAILSGYFVSQGEYPFAVTMGLASLLFIIVDAANYIVMAIKEK